MLKSTQYAPVPRKVTHAFMRSLRVDHAGGHLRTDRRYRRSTARLGLKAELFRADERMNLNLVTAALFCALVEFSLCIGMLVLWRREKSHYLTYWSTGFLSFGIGSLLISLRDKIPDFLSIFIANVSTMLSAVLFYIGICIFFGRRRTWLPWMLTIVSLAAIFLIYYSHFSYNTLARIYVYSTAQTLLALMTVQALFTLIRERDAIVNPEVVVVSLLFLAAHGARIAGTPLFSVPQDFLASGNFQTLLAFGLMVIHISYALAFGNMHSSALHAKLSAALADVKAKDRQKVEVLGYVSHDLRTPLTAISVCSALLLTDAQEEQDRPLQVIQRSVKYQTDLIDELLEYTKAELQPLAIQPVTTDLLFLLGDISEYAIALCSQQNNRFHYHSSDRIPRLVSLDGKRLQQVLLNLLSNAAKFTRDGEVTLSVVVSKPEDGVCTLHFAVSDTGEGIDLNQGIDIFSAFQQIQATNGSTGLGLFIAQRIVSAMGGALGVASTSGQGTRFSFEFSAPVIEVSESD